MNDLFGAFYWISSIFIRKTIDEYGFQLIWEWLRIIFDGNLSIKYKFNGMEQKKEVAEKSDHRNMIVIMSMTQWERQSTFKWFYSLENTVSLLLFLFFDDMRKYRVFYRSYGFGNRQIEHHFRYQRRMWITLYLYFRLSLFSLFMLSCYKWLLFEHLFGHHLTIFYKFSNWRFWSDNNYEHERGVWWFVFDFDIWFLSNPFVRSSVFVEIWTREKRGNDCL